MKITVPALALAAAVLVAPSAMAASRFNLYQDVDPGKCSQDAANAGNFGNQYTCSQTTTSADELAVRAYSTTGTGGRFAAAYVGDYSDLNSGFGGFGVKNAGETLQVGSPNHAMDNNGNLDALLFSFDSSIALKQLQLSWWSNDSDISVLRWTGAGDPVAALTNSTTADLLSSGWSLVGSYGNVGGAVKDINAGGLSSSYWLISAFNSTIGGGGGDTYKDYVKLAWVSGDFVCPPGTPGCGGGGGQVDEPASLALVGVALLGAVGLRRRRTTA